MKKAAKMKFHTLLQKILNERQIKPSEGARLCGMKPQQFGQYLNGNNEPGFNKGQEMIEALNWKLIPTPNE